MPLLWQFSKAGNIHTSVRKKVFRDAMLGVRDQKTARCFLL